MKKSQVISFFIRNKIFIVIMAIILILHLFFRFYLLFERADFGWDQVDSARAASTILVDHQYFINGPVAKGNSGIYMGPLYYYLITPFYFFTHLDPIASPVFQGVLSVVNLFIVFFVTKKLFGTNIAFMASFINTFSLTIMNADRVQSAYYLIVPVSYLIFYALYRVISGNEKSILYLAVFTGLAFHVDFVSVFYPILILLALPFFPRTKKSLKYILLSIPIFLLFLLPSLIKGLSAAHATTHSFGYLLQNYYHGIHVTRIFQLWHDAFISFEQILQFRFFRMFVFLVLPIFMVIYYSKNPKRQSVLLFYLMAIWIIVPWIVLSTYSGELTNYYFSLPMDLAIAMLAYITVFLFQRKQIIFKIIPVVFWGIYAISSMQVFFGLPEGNMQRMRQHVRLSVVEGRTIPYHEKSAESYFYYFFTEIEPASKKPTKS